MFWTYAYNELYLSFAQGLEESYLNKTVQRLYRKINFFYEPDQLYSAFVISDSQPPSFSASCLTSPLQFYAEKGKVSALVNWTSPVANDNSGLTPKVTSNYQSPHRFSRGTHLITYTAVDQSGNKATCTFSVKVTVINCTSLTVTFGGPLRKSSCGNHYGSMCNFSCSIGHRMNGSATVTCNARYNRPPGFWDNPSPTCQAIRCVSLPTPSNGLKTGCTDPLSEQYGAVCSFWCKVGYNLTGSSRRQCLENETWSGLNTSCQDSQPPSFGASCPLRPLQFYAEKGRLSALVNWTNPVATDNSGLTPKVTSNYQSPHRFSRGTHVIMYIAVDQSGNKATCTFSVKVIVIICTSLKFSPGGPLGMSSCGNHYGSMCNFSCSIGHRINGSSTVMCNARSSRPPGFWDNPPPTCQTIRCVSLPTPSNGLKIGCSDPLSEQYGVVCSFSCKVGYNLTGSSRRQCLENETWSGLDTSCQDKLSPSFSNGCPENMVFYLAKCSTFAQVSWSEPTVTDNSGHVIISYPDVRPPANLSLGLYDVQYSARDAEGNRANCSFIVQVAKKSCPPLQPPINGAITSLSCGWSFGSQASLSCNQGYRQRGSSVRSCESDGTWSGNATTCNVVKCPAIKPPLYGTVVPSSCKIQSGVDYNTDCFFACNVTNHYRLEGPSKVSCLENGSWSWDISNMTCKDIAPPSIKCPASTEVSTETGQSYATVTWDVPVPTDNSNEHLNVSGLRPPQKLDFGKTYIRYKVTDSAGLSSNCVFSIDVKDLEPPAIDHCPGDINITSIERFLHLVLPGVKVTDNVGLEDFTTHPANGSEVTWGEYDITYIASDKARNTAYCKFRITIADSECEDLPAPKNGAKACETWVAGIKCTVRCNPGYGLANFPKPVYVCRPSGKWFNAEIPGGSKKPTLPDCSKTFEPKEAWFSGEYHYITDKCGGEQMNKKIASEFIQLLKTTSVGQHICISLSACSEKNVKVECGEQTHRKTGKDGKIPMTVSFRLKVPLSNENNASFDINQTSNDIVTALVTADMTLTVSGVVIVSNMSRYPEIRLASFACDEGQVLNAATCVNCPVGYFFNGTSCQACAADKYQDQEAKTSCISCPPGTSTFGKQGSKLGQECLELTIRKYANTQQGMSKTELVSIIVGAVVTFVVLIVLGIWVKLKCLKGPGIAENETASVVGFFNQAYDSSDGLELRLQESTYSSEA